MFRRWLRDLDLPIDFDVGEGILLALFVIIFVVFMIFVGAPLLVFLVETLLIIPIVIVVGVLLRVLFRRPWTIEAADGSRRQEWKVVGWRASSRAADRMASQIAAAGSPDVVPPADKPQAHRRHAR